MTRNSIAFSERFWQVIACPVCGSSMQQDADKVTCSGCGETYFFNKDGQLDLRLPHPIMVNVDFELGAPLLPEVGFDFSALEENPEPAIKLKEMTIPWHLTRTLVSHFPAPIEPGALMLDLGCGDGVHRGIVEQIGFEWVGLDYSIPEAPIQGDGHALPFQDASFEFILSIAVLEHIQYPFVMMQEAARVLKADGVFIGTVSFMEPFHNDSYYHHSHLAVYNTLKNAGFKIKRISPAVEWPALVAIANMSLFRQMPIWLSRLIVLPVQALHRLWWALGYALTRAERASEYYRRITTTGAFSFIAVKE